MKRIRFVVVAASLLVSACGFQKTTNPAFMSSQNYQQRSALSTSLFSGDQAVISNEDIAKILDSKVELPSDARVAVLRWGPRNTGYSQDMSRLDKQLLDDFMIKIEGSKRIRDVSVMPSLLIPDQMTIPHIRGAGARFQAHYVLIYRTQSDLYEKHWVLKRNEVRAYSTVELVLLDVRTGTVPFSAVMTEDYTAERSDDELRFTETMRTAERKAVHTAMADGADGLLAFLDTVP